MKDEALRLALEALENNKRTHYYCEDTWYSCPKHEDGCANDAEGDECNCGADKTNAEIDATINAIKQVLEQSVATNDTSQDRVDETAKQRHEPEPVAWVDLLKEAQKIVESKPLWKRFIAGTPLANDIACWMADFAQLVAQKCAEIADTAEPYQSADLIRKHFGVENDHT